MGGIPQTRLGACPELGLQRVSWVRIVVGPGRTTCEVAGMAHRRPVLRTVPLRTATALLAAGVPGVVRTAGTPAAPAPAGVATVAGNAG
ncbi:MAG TPA: hypothetical protein VM263_02270 [Acidimicrobiales bacterium]|jgi:hypothetical protein|nr:hypothetical protein [Acidimicrobiales bacterium]